MTEAAIAADLHQALDVHGNLTAQVALNLQVVVNVVTDLTDILFGQVLNARIRIDTGRLDDIVRNLAANAVDIGQGDLNSLLAGQVDTSDSCQGMIAPPTCFRLIVRRFGERQTGYVKEHPKNRH